jgi:hypothetical protein
MTRRSIIGTLGIKGMLTHHLTYVLWPFIMHHSIVCLCSLCPLCYLQFQLFRNPNHCLESFVPVPDTQYPCQLVVNFNVFIL